MTNLYIVQWFCLWEQNQISGMVRQEKTIKMDLK
jgi:hypothetical protein